jgi:hypothetical protein
MTPCVIGDCKPSTTWSASRMQIILKNRETLTGTVTVFSTVFDASSMPVFTATLIAYAMAGTAPTLTVQFQTSEDLETWLDVSGALSLSATGVNHLACRAETAVYGRYVRAEIETTGTNPLANYSLVVDLFPSS